MTQLRLVDLKGDLMAFREWLIEAPIRRCLLNEEREPLKVVARTEQPNQEKPNG
jgi:hypothetical protein